MAQETQRQKIVRALLDFRSEKYGGCFCTDADAEDFLVDSRYWATAFLFGVIFDQKIPAPRAWAAPFQLYKRLGHLDIRRIAYMPFDNLRKAIANPPALHVYVNKLPQWIQSAAEMVVEHYNGKPESIWSGSLPAAVVISRLDKFLGVSQKKATMAANSLVNDFGVYLTGWEDIDVSVDRNLARVFMRAGLAEKATIQSIVAAARELSPEYPGKLDWPAWSIGRENGWCFESEPDCYGRWRSDSTPCPLEPVCPKLIAKGANLPFRH